MVKMACEIVSSEIVGIDATNPEFIVKVIDIRYRDSSVSKGEVEKARTRRC